MITLHDYQQEAVSAAAAELSRAGAALVVMPTGTGKSFTGVAVAKEVADRGGRVLVLMHRGELFGQWGRSCDAFGLSWSVEKAEEHALRDAMFGRTQVVLGSKDTLQGKRLERWKPNTFDLIIVDECFPAGTLVDGRPIEQWKPGEHVDTFNHVTAAIDRKPIEHLYRSVPDMMVRVHFDDGTSMACTPGHPFYVPGEGYVMAVDLASDPNYFVLKESADEGREGDDPVRQLRGRRHAQGQVATGEGREGVLLGPVPEGGHESTQFGADGRDQSQTCFGPDEGQESDAPAGDQREDGQDAQGDWPRTTGPLREWLRANRDSIRPGGGTRHRIGGDRRPDANTEGVGISDLLQDRPRLSGPETRDRGRRWVTLYSGPPGPGSQEGRVFDAVGVDRVEILEPGRDGTFGGVCPDGHVYNIEVADNHNYFAAGVLVHNCHHGNQKTYLKVLGHFHKARRLGLTATPERSDDESIQPVFGNCAYELKFWEAVDRGYIKAPLFKRPPCAIDLSALRSSGEDLNQGDLEDAISSHVELLVNLARPELESRQAMCFTPRVFSATAMADGFRQVGVTACSVSGKSEDRQSVVARFRASQFQLLSSCDLLREGADFPEVSAGVLARPTKSGLVYRQMLGRMLRRHPENPAAIVVDYAWVSGKHDLFRPIDLFDATGMDLDVLRLAEGLLDRGTCDPREALREAERVHELEVAARVRVQERAPRYRMVAYDPFQVGALLGVPNRQRDGQKPITPINRARLGAHKLESGGISNAQAERLLKGLEERRRQGMATHRMVALLVDKGVPAEVARGMRFEEARGDLDILVGRKEA